MARLDRADFWRKEKDVEDIMSTQIRFMAVRYGRVGRALGTAAVGLLIATGYARAQTPVTMAPPVQAPDTAASDSTNTSQDSVFDWREVPQGEQVVLTRASFDRGGYQLYDTVGETIVVPFADQNLYVMKFGKSTTGEMYFVNNGSEPVLYVPDNGYLENATTAGGRWYPFSKEFRPEQPVYLGIAPSWSAFSDMGWYPGMTSWGGYYSNTAFVTGRVFAPTVGLFFEIGGRPYYGWDSYYSYRLRNPGFIPVGYFRNDLYRWSNRPRGSFHAFGGGSSIYYAHRPFNGVRNLNGVRNFGRDGRDGNRFRGGNNGYAFGNSFGGNRNDDRRPTFRGGNTPRGNNPFRGDNSFRGGNSFGGNSFGGNGGSNPSFRGGRDGSRDGSRDRSGGVRVFGGGSSFNGDRGTGRNLQNGGNGSSFGGNRNFGGSRGGGGSRPSGGGRSGGGGGRRG